MTYQLTALYHHPVDVAAFDRHYDTVHAVLASKMPGVRAYSISRPGPDANGARPVYHLVAVVTWDSEEDFNAAIDSPAGKTTLADLDNFAGAGVDILTGPSRAVV